MLKLILSLPADGLIGMVGFGVGLKMPPTKLPIESVIFPMVHMMGSSNFLAVRSSDVHGIIPVAPFDFPLFNKFFACSQKSSASESNLHQSSTSFSSGVFFVSAKTTFHPGFPETKKTVEKIKTKKIINFFMFIFY